jgi:hypothetical protein
MARIALGALTTLNTSTHLDAMFVELYQLRDLFTVSSSLAGLGATPLYPLHVASTSGSILALDRNTDVTSSGAAAATIEMGARSGSTFSPGASISAVTDNPATTGYLSINTRSGGALAERLRIDTSGHGLAGVDNTQTWGTSARRWSVIYAGTGSINTSDAREKTPVSAMTSEEIAVALDLAREIGTYSFLAAVASKGEDARLHVGMTVQRAIEIMESHGLDPMRYGFICHDEWDEEIVRHEPVFGFHPTLLADNGQPLRVEVSPERLEVRPAGDRYSFRPDEMLFFIARGLEARITALESA